METPRIAQIIDEMGTLLELKGENPFRCRAYHTAAQSLSNLPGDLREMIADGSLKEVAGIGETMYAKIVALATTGQLPAYDDAAAEHAAELGRALADSGSWAQEDQGAARDAQGREPGRPAGGGRGGQDCRIEGLRGQDRGQHPGRDRVCREGRRANPPERCASAGRADPGGDPQSSPGDPGRVLRQPAPPCRDDRRSRHPVQLEGRARRCSIRSSSCPRSRRCWLMARPRPASGWPTAFSATCAGSRTRSIPLRSITSPARRPTISRCASARWRGG